MIKIAVYGKGGIGKSTTISNVAVAMAEQGLTVMQIGCDPKADSTVLLRHGKPVETVLDLVRNRKNDFTLSDMVMEGYRGVLCVEAGGPAPGMGCAGRGIIAALEKLAEKGAYEVYQPDVVIYDVLGDVVCGGFAMPIRGGYADDVLIVTSGEMMALFAAENIARAIKNFGRRGYAKLAGYIQNSRNVEHEDELVKAAAKENETKVLYVVPRDRTVQMAENQGKTVIEAYPESDMARCYRSLADKVLEVTA